MISGKEEVVDVLEKGDVEVQDVGEELDKIHPLPGNQGLDPPTASTRPSHNRRPPVWAKEFISNL